MGRGGARGGTRLEPQQQQADTRDNPRCACIGTRKSLAFRLGWLGPVATRAQAPGAAGGGVAEAHADGNLARCGGRCHDDLARLRPYVAALPQRRGREAAAVEPPYRQQLKSVEQRAREAWLVHRACGHGIRHRVFTGICMCVCAIDKPRRAGELALGIDVY